MNRSRLVVATLVVCGGLLGPTGIAAAEGETAPPTPGAEAATANRPPLAAPDTATVQAGKAVTVAVLANDSDPDNGPQPLAVTSVTDASGRATLNGTAVTFVARSADAGTRRTFSYTVTDGAETATATVGVTVTAPPKTAPPPVARHVSITLAPEVVALRSYTLHGTANVADKRPIDVTVQQLSGSRWVTYRTDRADAAGAWAVPFSTSSLKRYAFRAVAVWNDGKRATSSQLARTVVAKPDVVVSGPLSSGDVPYSYRSGCPVTPSGLRRVTMNHIAYSGRVARGSLILRASSVPDMLTVFKASFAARFPLHTLKPTDAFYDGGRRTPTESDLAAMRADNTSAFNCRPVTGNPYRVSQHSYGNAIDINTVRNPYVVGSRVYPSFAGTYLNRSNVRTGMITSRGVLAGTMRRVGWPWGARWSHPDYQHFSSNGG